MLSPLPLVKGLSLSTFECRASRTKPTKVTVLPSPSVAPLSSLMILASLARLGGGSPLGMLGSLVLASPSLAKVCKVTDVSLLAGAQRLFFCAFCSSFAAPLLQPVFPQRKSIRCGLCVKGLSCNGRGLPQV